MNSILSESDLKPTYHMHPYKQNSEELPKSRITFHIKKKKRKNEKKAKRKNNMKITFPLLFNVQKNYDNGKVKEKLL